MAAWEIYLIIALVTYRATRFLIQDTWPPIKWPRDQILNWLDPLDEDWLTAWFMKHEGTERPKPHLGALGRTLRYLGTCPWCMSVWVGALLVYVFTLYTSVPLPVAAWAVAAAATGLISKNLDPDED